VVNNTTTIDTTSRHISAVFPLDGFFFFFFPDDSDSADLNERAATSNKHYTQTSMIDSVDFFIDRDCICTGVGKDGALLQRDRGSRLHRGLLCSKPSSMERTTLATAYHDFK